MRLFSAPVGMLLFLPCAVALLAPKTARLQPSPLISKLHYSTFALNEQKEELKSRLPPVDPTKMSKLEIEFRELLEGILYTTTEMEAIASPRIRNIYKGISASYYEPAVYRAFEVLYEDYMPLRVAGRMVYGRLKEVMEESNVYRQSQFDQLSDAVGEISNDTLLYCWSSFIRLAEDRELPKEKIVYIEKRAIECANNDDQDNQIAWNVDGKDGLTFAETMVGLHGFAKSSGGEPENFFRDIWNNDWGPMSTSQLDPKRAKYNKRYDDMIEQFNEWKDFIPDGEGRRLDILKGCFVGSENEAVVEALRVIYTDNSALRMSGNWIFKVVSTIMNSTIRRGKRHLQ